MFLLPMTPRTGTPGEDCERKLRGPVVEARERGDGMGGLGPVGTGGGVDVVGEGGGEVGEGRDE